MEVIQVGWLSILPPLIAIVLALLTKEVISSLMVGILSGTFIYALCTVSGAAGVVVSTVEHTFTLMASKAADNINIILFLCLLGALVVVVTRAGGSRAYGAWAASKLRSKRSAQLATAGLGVLIFIDDYFNCLTVGTVMKPVTDKYGVSRAKLAYLIDATAAPVCIIAPISSWAAAVGSNLQGMGGFDTPMAAFISSIPYNLYALLSLLLVVFLCVTNLDFGPMAKAQQEAAAGNLGAVETAAQVEQPKTSDKGRVFDLIIPVVGLIIFSVLAMLYTGGYFSGEGVSIADAFGNCDSSASLVLGGFGGLVVAFLLFVPRGVVGFRDFMDGIGEGIKSMVPACIILTLAWTISGVCRDMLGTGEYVGELVKHLQVPFAILPAIIFAVAALLSFSMGTAWGTFGILIPIVMEVMASTTNMALLTAALAATLAGSVFGDHCSPISDTTILSSTGAGCDHMQHVSTQMVYALAVAAASFVGYLVGGLAGGNVFVTLGTGIVALGLILVAKQLVARTKA